MNRYIAKLCWQACSRGTSLRRAHAQNVWLAEGVPAPGVTIFLDYSIGPILEWRTKKSTMSCLIEDFHSYLRSCSCPAMNSFQGLQRWQICVVVHTYSRIAHNTATSPSQILAVSEQYRCHSQRAQATIEWNNGIRTNIPLYNDILR